MSQDERTAEHCTHLLTCPICHSPFMQVDQTLKCAKAHSFDIAREGYVNLLLQKRPGDTKEMLRARRDILEQGLYSPVSARVNELVRAHLQPVSDPLHILDAGCGEGYYLARLQRALASQPHNCYIGMDSSKEAARMAAKRYSPVLFVVADIKQRLPLADASIHTILNIFAPRNPGEFARITAPGSMLIVVIPGPQHLLRLRTELRLLNIEEQKQQHVKEQFAEQFAFVASSTISYPVHLNRHQVEQLVIMTPNYWHQSHEMHQAILNIEEIETEVECTALVFRRK